MKSERKISKHADALTWEKKGNWIGSKHQGHEVRSNVNARSEKREAESVVITQNIFLDQNNLWLDMTWFDFCELL